MLDPIFDHRLRKKWLMGLRDHQLKVLLKKTFPLLAGRTNLARVSLCDGLSQKWLCFTCFVPQAKPNTAYFDILLAVGQVMV